nr:helix-turn-helix transcriptional regulator [Clostridium tyrobutyricum]
MVVKIVAHQVNDIGKEVKKYREENRISLRELSKITGVSYSWLNKLENGKATLRKGTEELLINKLNLDNKKIDLTNIPTVYLIEELNKRTNFHIKLEVE